jgi:Glycosyl transferase family 2
VAYALALPARHWIMAAPLLVGLALRIRSDDGLGTTAAVGLLAIVAAYVVCERFGVWRWLAALATIPAVLDDRLLQEQASRPLLALALASMGLLGYAWRGPDVPPRQLAPIGLVLVAGLVLGFGTSVTTADPGVLHLHLVRPVTSLLALIGLLAALGVGRDAPLALRGACILGVGLGSAHGLNEVVWWPATGVLGLTAMLRGSRGASAQRPQRDRVDDVALAEFSRRYGRPRLGPVAIVIAAYNEADSIRGVLDALPAEVCGLRSDVVVVDDASTDGTASALSHGRGYVVSCSVNRGQGAALRLGYRVAREHGARYLITTDADGQYAASDMPALLTPILEDRADFVTGSRILGHQQTRDRVRRLGVHVFGWLATILTGHRHTDTSFGLRAMRAEVTAAIALNQRQYQSSELLLAVVSHGFRTVEVPATMNLRSAGSTKKGNNFAYGRRYARAMTGTWLREGLPRPVGESAPALRHTRGHGD